MPSPPLSLSLSLDQPPPSPTSGPEPTLTVRITVKNTSQDGETYTILKWSSPLDPLALALALVSVTIPSASEGDGRPGTPFDIPRIMLKRAMPPPEDAFVTLAPGESESHDIVLREPAIDMGKLVSAAKEASSGGPVVVNVRVTCGSSDGEAEDEDQRGAVVWRGKRKEDLSEEEILSLGRGNEEGGGAARWKFESNVLGLLV